MRTATLAASLAVALPMLAIPAGAAASGITTTPARPVVGKVTQIAVRLTDPAGGVSSRTTLYASVTTPSGGIIRTRLIHVSALRWRGQIAFALKGTWKVRIVTANPSSKALASASVRVRSA
jgi:hypothetical protein